MGPQLTTNEKPEPPLHEEQELRLRKLRAETIKAEDEAHSLRRTLRRRFVAEILPLITAVVAVGGLLATLWSQRIELDRQRDERARADSVRHTDALAAEVRRFSESATLPGRIGALANFGRYWRDSADRRVILSLVLAHINVERDPTVRESIRELVLQDPDSATLMAVADQNRFIQRRIHRRIRNMWPEALTVMAFPDQASENDWTQSDSLLRWAREDLGWNIKLFVALVHQLRTVERADLSHVLLSRPEEPDGHLVWSGWDEGWWSYRGVIFKDVRFTGASFAGVRFHSVTFIDTNLDSVNLAGSEFSHCEFRGQTSLAAFLTYLMAVKPGGGGRKLGPFPPTWHLSKLDVADFYPRYSRFEMAVPAQRRFTTEDEDSDEEEDSRRVFYTLARTTWRVRNLPQDSRYPKGLILPPTNRDSSRFDGVLE